MWHRSHINQPNRWFSGKITFRPKQIYMAGMKHVFPLETGNREGGGGGHSRGSLETQICTHLLRICSISWDPFQIKWLFRGILSRWACHLTVPCNLGTRKSWLLVFTNSGQKNIGRCLSWPFQPFPRQVRRWPPCRPWLGSKKFVGQ